MAANSKTNYDHALHILETLGFYGEQAESQAYAISTYLEIYVVGPRVAESEKGKAGAIREFPPSPGREEGK
jgi:hypothetical protein